MYDVGALPGESDLRSDLGTMLHLYGLAIEIKRNLLLTSPGAIASPSSPQVTPGDDPLAGFKPKDSSDYTAHLIGRHLIKSRRHEKLVKDFGLHCVGRGFTPTTEHPRDLVLRRSGVLPKLVEAKIVYRGNATGAVRGAVGQLLTYAHFLYKPSQRPQLVALFNETVGAAYRDFLESIDIATIWLENGKWVGSPLAVAANLVDG